MEASAAGIPRPGGPQAVSVWKLLRDALLGRPDRWDPATDDTLRYLRTQRVLARRETRRLQEVAWEDLLTGKERR